MGEIVAAFGVCHAPQLIWRPPDEKPEMLDASIAAMRQLGKILDETRPDAIIFLGSDHLETYSLNCIPTFALVAGSRAVSHFGGKKYDLPIHRELAENLLENLVRADFDIAYSEFAELGHTFAVPFEYVLEGRDIPVVPFLTNVYLPPLPSMNRCAALGRQIRKVVESRKERVCLLSSGGMSHYPGTPKYHYPEFDFDRWMISQLEIGNFQAILNLTPEQLDEAGNTEMLNWAPMLGALGSIPGELLQYTPTWHHGHGYMRFLPQRERKTAVTEAAREFGGFQFKNQGFEFYVHPPAHAYNLNRLLFEVRHDPDLRKRIMNDPEAVGADYGLEGQQRKSVRALVDATKAKVVSEFVKPLAEAGAHPLQALMCLHTIASEARRQLQEASKS
jgi:aromatic ring-opening dioxygenase catalytic subunit (LigB family)